MDGRISGAWKDVQEGKTVPGYQRFVTYMFRYENGRKQENCGFAKVEIRHQECRIQIQLKGVQGEHLEVYLLNENAEFPVGLLLGMMSVHDGTAGGVFRCEESHIINSKYGIHDIRGIYIANDGYDFYASQWDDQQTRWENFKVWKPDMEKPEADITKENTEDRSVLQNNESVSGQQKLNDREGTGKHFDSQSNESVALKKDEGDIIKEADQKEIMHVESDKSTENQNVEHDRMEDQKELQATQQNENVSAEQFVSAEPAGQMLSGWEMQWKRFTAAHAMFCPFDEDDGVYGVKLKMQDFQVLPKRYHYLANNSFLLHGYYNYQMILFGYMDGKEKQWFLGVPGVFSNQEQLLAGIFGFPEFRTKQVTRQKTGEFGYWYRYLDMKK